MLSDDKLIQLAMIHGLQAPEDKEEVRRIFSFARAIDAAARREALNEAIHKLNANTYSLTKRECIEEIRALIDQPSEPHLVPGAAKMVSDALPNVVQTAPAEIYLCLGDDDNVLQENFSELYEVSWSYDKATAHTIKYVRADVATVKESLTTGAGDALPADYTADAYELAGMVMTDCGVSWQYERLRERVAKRITAALAQSADAARHCDNCGKQAVTAEGRYALMCVDCADAAFSPKEVDLGEDEHAKQSFSEYLKQMKQFGGDALPASVHFGAGYKAGRSYTQSADAKDAARYRLLRRGQHWSVINGIGDDLRGDALDDAIDAAMQGKQEG